MTTSDLIAEYIQSLALGKSKHTQRSYRTGLHQILADVLRKPASALTPERIIAEAQTKLKRLTPGTIHAYTSALAEFLHWSLLHDRIKMSSHAREQLFESITQMRPRYARLPKLVSPELIDRMIADARAVPALGEGTTSQIDRHEQIRLRDVALLLALKTSGMRVGEIVGIQRGDVDADTRSAIVTGKGNKQRIVYFDAETWRAITTYLEARKDGKETRGIYLLPLFAAHCQSSASKLHPLTTKSVERIFKTITRRAGIDVPVSPHSFRHYFATRMLDASGDLAIVQDMLGHSSPATTRIYAKVSNKKIYAAHQAAFGK